MASAPPQPSSPGWKMKWTMPSKLRVSARYLAAPSSMVVWPSCPQACIAPFTVLRKGRSVSSSIGSASISARSPMARLPEPFRSTPTTPVPPTPRWTSIPSASRAVATFSAVRNSAMPSSGWACRSRRKAVSSAWWRRMASIGDMMGSGVLVSRPSCPEAARGGSTRA